MMTKLERQFAVQQGVLKVRPLECLCIYSALVGPSKCKFLCIVEYLNFIFKRIDHLIFTLFKIEGIFVNSYTGFKYHLWLQ